jgi:hypothetical protein
MRELGRAGGKASVRRRLGFDLGADESLRAKARRRIEAQLDSDDERLAQAAARALYSYGPAKPPAGAAEGNSWQHTPHRGVAIAKVLEIAVCDARESSTTANMKTTQTYLHLAGTVFRAEAEAHAQRLLGVEPSTNLTSPERIDADLEPRNEAEGEAADAV